MLSALRTATALSVTVLAFAAACGEVDSTPDGNRAGAGGGAGQSVASSGGIAGQPNTAAGGIAGQPNTSSGGTAGQPGASSGGAASCQQPIPEGTTFHVTLLSETARSDHCHVVDLLGQPPFDVVAGTAEPPMCEAVPATAPPPQSSVRILTCLPLRTDMLGIICSMEYPAGCLGTLRLAFVAGGSTVDWSAPRIDNVLFSVTDFSPNCLPDIANCRDEYNARLERVTARVGWE